MSANAQAAPGGATLQVNGQAQPLPADGLLATLVAQLGHAPEAVASAVNGQLVARSQRAQHRLRSGDAVLLFQAIVGG